MHLRIRVLDIDDVPEDSFNVVVAKSGLKRPNAQLGRPMKMLPAILEMWDGLEWLEVKIVPKDAGNKSPYTVS
jgi:hypothetical protein